MRRGDLLEGRLRGELRQARRMFRTLDRPRTGPESIHRLRITLRRLGLLLSILREAVRTDELQNRIRAIGPLRDLQMFGRWLRGLVVEGRISAPLWAPCEHWLRLEERRLRVSLSGRRSWLERPLKTLERQRWADEFNRLRNKHIRHIFQKNAHHLVDAMEALPARPGVSKLHRVRRRVRQLRYLVEFLGKNGRARRKLLSRLKGWQRLLGQVQDLDAAARTFRRMLAALPAHIGRELRRRSLSAFLRREKSRYRKEFLKSWSRRRRRRLKRWVEKLEPA